jgi:hypothetical protein
MSNSSTHAPAIDISASRNACSAWCGDRFGRKPYEPSRKSGSYTASSSIVTARCSTLSSKPGTVAA